MAEETWHYLENQFASVTAGNRKLMHAILKDHYDKLAAGVPGDARLQPLMGVLDPVYTEWTQKYGAWKNSQAAYRSASQAMLNLLDVLRERPPGGGRSKIDEWASKIASYWSASDPNYDFLLPQGREPFTTGSRDEMIGEVERLGQRLLTKKAELAAAAADPQLDEPEQQALTEQANAMDALAAKVSAFHAQLSAARTLQTQKEGAVDQLSGQVRPARLAAADALYHSLAGLMAIFYKAEGRDQVTGFFDLTLIMSPPEPSDQEPDPGMPPAGGGGTTPAP